MRLFKNNKNFLEENAILVKEESLNGFIKRQDIIMSELLVELETAIDERNLAKFKVHNIHDYTPLTNISLTRYIYNCNNGDCSFIVINGDKLNDKIYI